MRFIQELVLSLRLLFYMQVVATGLCQSDLYFLYKDMNKDFFPLVLGHEAAGIVESVGKGVTEFQPGQSNNKTPTTIKYHYLSFVSKTTMLIQKLHF